MSNVSTRRVDLTGRRFGRWTVLLIAPGYRWLCRCDCGTEREVLARTLMDGTSTGCIKCSRRPGGWNLQDLVGHRFGKLLVIKKGPRRASTKANWWCTCDCGRVSRLLSSAALLHQASKQCHLCKTDAMVADVTGQRFDRLVVLEKLDTVPGKRKAFWRCQCDCGELTVVDGAALRNGHSTQCGRCGRNTLIHGHATRSRGYTRTYSTWMAMKSRCNNPKNESYSDYGGRGITVCQQWLDSFENFLSDMGERPVGMTIERDNVNGNYEPTNCRWATAKEQARNKRRKGK